MIQIAPLPQAQAVNTAQTPQTVTNVLPGVQGQAAAPITANAVKPAPKTGSGQKVVRKGEKDRDDEKGEQREEGQADGRGGNVNISI